MSTTTIESVVVLVAMSAAAGVLGCFVAMRRMVLASDALSHVALPGIGAALLLRIHPLAGAMAALLFGTLLIWGIERRSRLAVETVIGVVFSAALALGSMMTSGDELIHALLGKPTGVTASEALIVVSASAAVLAFFAVRKREIIVSLISRDIATSMGIQMRWLDLQFLLAFAATVGLGLRYLGVLLMGSLVIIPAAAARRIASNLRGMLIVAVSVALVSTLAGTWIGTRLGTETGPPIVLVASACLLVTLLSKARG